MLNRQKEQQRREVLARRDAMGEGVRAQFSHSLIRYADILLPDPEHFQQKWAPVLRETMRKNKELEQFVKSSETKTALEGQIISAFLPIRSEIDPRPLIAHLRAKAARLALPALLDKPAPHIIFRAFEAEDALIPMRFGTLGPPQTAPLVEPDVILLPLAAYDKRGNRIGYGGGHYDRAIADMRRRGLNPKLVGLAFSCQEMANIAAEAHDIKLDAILTEQGLRYFS